MKIMEEEKEYLNFTLESIDKEIKNIFEKIEVLKKESIGLSFEDRQKGTHFQLNNHLQTQGKNLIMLKKSRSSPYFGRIDFVSEENDGKLKIYIGKTGITHNSDKIVTDWRAPVCGLYYDSEVGNVNFQSPTGIENGKLLLKRQINIKNGELLDAIDASIVVNDDLLKPYLNVNAENKMKDIVASIQKEQNNIIRKSANNNIIVQGVAGSGKTSVALHRIAYLIYNMSETLNSNQFLVIGPNDYFLNYISSILPELDTSPVEQNTLISLLNNYIGENFSIKNYDIKETKTELKELNRSIEKYKSSLDYKKALNMFLDDYFNNGIVLEDFIIDDEIIYTKEKIKEILFFSDNKPNYKGTILYFKNDFKNKLEEIYEKLNKKYKDIYISLPPGNIEREEAIKKSNELNLLIKKDGINLLTKYLKKLDISILKIYMLFINNIEKYATNLNEKEILYLKKNTLMELKKKNITFVDIPALMHINYKKTNKKLDYKHIIIDEAQDYGLFHFDVLKEISDNAIFSIYGDLAQSIYSFRSIETWEEVNEKVFNNSCELLNLSKSYRTTIEITENANKILQHLNLLSANPVIRHGKKILYYDFAKDNDYKINQIKEWINKGYKTIAIICKTDKEVKEVEKVLKQANLDVKSLSFDDNEYKGGLFVLTSAASKGLEFDAVMINDAGEKVYSSDSDVDMHLLYVASTRALHELVILYDKKLTNVYESNLLEETKHIKKLKL